MTRLGHIWVDMNAVSAICKNLNEPGYSLFLNCGRIVGLPEATEADILAALEESGLYDIADAGTLDLTERELGELAQAYAVGFHFAAADDNGQCYAYKDAPTKSGPYWNANEAASAPQTRRLHADSYACLQGVETPLCLDNIPEVVNWYGQDRTK